MLVLNTNTIHKSGGLYNLQADQNLTELKSIMKDIIVKERAPQSKVAMWASDNTISTKDKDTPAEGGRLWARTGVYRPYQPKKKREPKTPTFSL